MWYTSQLQAVCSARLCFILLLPVSVARPLLGASSTCCHLLIALIIDSCQLLLFWKTKSYSGLFMVSTVNKGQIMHLKKLFIPFSASDKYLTLWGIMWSKIKLLAKSLQCKVGTWDEKNLRKLLVYKVTQIESLSDY